MGTCACCKPSPLWFLAVPCCCCLLAAYPAAAGGGPALQWSLSGLFAMGGSSADADELEQLEGGTHDPRKNGFTVQALALAAHADLARNVDATASIVGHVSPDGDNVVELEQAYIRYEDSPRGMTALAGQYYPDFGRANKQHPDDWDFVDVPFLITRLFGSDKLRSQGVQLAWDTPLPWQSTLYLGANNPDGETATSFLYQPGESVGGHVLQARQVEGLDDLLYLLRWSHDTHAPTRNLVGLGVSALFGPNASGDSTRTQIYGADVRWTRYRDSTARQPRFDWRTEAMFRRYEAGDNGTPDHETLHDYGVFSEAVWPFRSAWSAGLRAEFADGNSSAGDPERDERKRLSVSLTRRLFPSLRARLQYNHDQADWLAGNSADSVWFQLVYQAGAHGEH